MGSEVIHCGTVGTGHAMKALNNFINANALITAFEALSLGKRFGLDTETMLQSMTAAATGRNNPIEKKSSHAWPIVASLLAWCWRFWLRTYVSLPRWLTPWRVLRPLQNNVAPCGRKPPSVLARQATKSK